MSTQPDTAIDAALSDQALGWLRTMLLIRRFEERAEQLTTRGKSPAEFTRPWARRRRQWVWRRR